jgi:hypothetical protein
VPGSGTYCQVMELEPHGDVSGGGLGVLSCESFFPFFLWLVVSVFGDSERALLFDAYGTPWVPFGGPVIFLYGGSWSPLGYRNVNNPPSCPSPLL